MKGNLTKTVCVIRGSDSSITADGEMFYATKKGKIIANLNAYLVVPLENIDGMKDINNETEIEEIQARLKKIGDVVNVRIMGSNNIIIKEDYYCVNSKYELTESSGELIK